MRENLKRYHDPIQELRNQHLAAPAVAQTPDPEEVPAAEASAEVADLTWAEDLLKLLRDTPCDPISLGLPDLVPGNPSNGCERGSTLNTWSGNRHVLRGPDIHKAQSDLCASAKRLQT